MTKLFHVVYHVSHNQKVLGSYPAINCAFSSFPTFFVRWAKHGALPLDTCVLGTKGKKLLLVKFPLYK